MDADRHPHCPACGWELLEFSFQHQRLDQCAHCGGVWLDAGELDRLAHGAPKPIQSLELDVKVVEAREREAALPPGAAQAMQVLFQHSCPRCAEALSRTQDHGIPVDRCGRCGGSWLEAGQLEQVLGSEHGFLHALKKAFLAAGSARGGLT